MRVRLQPFPAQQELDEDLAHSWQSHLNEMGVGAEVNVWGVSKRGGRCLLLLIPYSDMLGDVFFSRIESWEFLDTSIPNSWRTKFEVFDELLAPVVKDFDLIADPLFRSTKDFLWRLSENQLSSTEWDGVKAIVRKEKASKPK
ncbi:hypothetical protein K3729_02775 [Rhodobacteraceae bacterium S2214]|nr:hypothetical protein K3729_02775 [Rhodobacteraceae bacterium S2214]